MGKSSTTGLSAVVVAGLLVGSAATDRADAAQITFQLRPTSGLSAVVGSTMTFDIYAVIQNNNGNNADDGFTRLHTSLISTEFAAGFSGDISVPTLNTTQANGGNGVLDGSVSQSGTQQNLD